MSNPVFYDRLSKILHKRRELLYKLAEKDTIFIDSKDIIEINRIIMAEHNGIHGVRDLNLLESAISSVTFNREYDDIKDKRKLGIILMERIIKNHPFVDGNKRTSIVAMEMFFDANLVELDLDNDWLYKTAYMIAQKKITVDAIFRKLTKNEPLLTNNSYLTP